ncbi:hypothetical protein ACERK3_19580 [Phycisphaerales bacterium AB-hyl4]|uniref:Uncharacterized protein n=1 Tax=Natronomicrosphaera hydrolytica TaxID=3242702 RepID=A0ABV4UC90_9BACT
MSCRVYDPAGDLMPWRTITDAAGNRRELCAIGRHIFERCTDDHEPEPIGDLVRQALAVVKLQDEVAAMGPAAGEAGPQGQGPQPAGSAAGEDTQPDGRGPIEAGGREPPGERLTAGRPDAGDVFTNVDLSP